MFVLREDLDHLELGDGGSVLNFMASINQPLVAAADRPPELTHAYICSVQEESGLVNVYIMLHLLKSDIKVLYSLDKSLPMEMLREAEDEALTFTENMGFLMDAVPIARLSNEEKVSKLSSYPMFGGEGVVQAPEGDIAEELEEIVEEIDIVPENADALAAEGEGDVGEVIEDFEAIPVEEAAPVIESALEEIEEIVVGDDEPSMEGAVAEDGGDSEVDMALEAAFGSSETDTKVPDDIAPLEEEGAKTAGNLGRWIRFLSSF